MFSFNNTLKTLKLKHSALLDLPSPVCMKSLRTLHLDCVDFKDNQSIRNLIYGFPNLENLVIDRGYPNVVLNFVIVVPFLKTLSIKDYSGLEDGGYVINTPLKYLKIKGLEGFEICLIENAPELVEANIRNVFGIVNEKIM
ncbi:F-box/LRR-repeat protein [Cardamine amara subsp. amara]|uniref:F-box/LRR-repeat protein n=1 Tax=Cardamine amara subsp. amara TaxID=228776 RepID=A0ABD1AFP0_CARAN